jgi:hypothetical protein
MAARRGGRVGEDGGVERCERTCVRTYLALPCVSYSIVTRNVTQTFAQKREITDDVIIAATPATINGASSRSGSRGGKCRRMKPRPSRP